MLTNSLKKYSFDKATDKKKIIFGLESPKGTLFLVCSNKASVSYICDMKHIFDLMKIVHSYV